ncbi:MAG TPA: winged helix-turn-helix transcriptional regulator [Paracoccus sp.]|nr:winged helix-turn-helix transcriptional regulator [Paracoccus sp. (in: a-proteobacteria)]
MSAEPAPDRRPAPDRLVEAAAPTPPGVPSASPPSASHVAEQIVHLARLVHGGASDQCLTPAQWTALRYFARANRFSRTPSAFSEFHATTRGTASQTVKSLITMGYLERHANENDARSTLIEVTEAGRAKLTDDPLRALTQAIDYLPPPERSLFADLISGLATTMARVRTAPLFGNCGDCGHCDTTNSGPAYCRCTQSLLDHGDMSALCVDFSPVTPRPR